MAYEMLTRNGHSFYEMTALMQGAIRRGNVKLAGYAAAELFYKYRNYLWRRLLIISTEDCYGIMTGEILALMDAEKRMTEKNETIFISKAIVLLCYARKNRDADYFACNLMRSDQTIPPEEIEALPIERYKLDDGRIPDWAFNWHTRRGRQMGKDVVDAVNTNQECLEPLQLGMFDDCTWNYDINNCLKQHNPKRRPIPYDDGKREPDGNVFAGEKNR